MTIEAGGAQPRVDAKAEQRRSMDRTILAFRSLARDARIASEQRLDPAQAITDLADTGVPRVVKLRILADGLLRARPELDDALNGAIDRLIERTLPEGLDENAKRSGVTEVRRHLEQMAEEGGERLQQTDWNAFAERTKEVYSYDLSELSFATRCNDQELAPKATPEGRQVQSRLIEAEFLSDLPPMAFARYVNPVNWPLCSSTWLAMNLLSGQFRESGDYDCVFDEVVEINNRVLRVPLAVGYRERPGGSRVWVRYNIARGPYLRRALTSDPVPVDVDTGTVSAERLPDRPELTLVRATKYLHVLREDDAMFPELACDAGWPDLMIAMAQQCMYRWPREEQDTAEPEAPAAAPAAATGAARQAHVDFAVRQFVDQVATECRDGIDQAKPHVRRLIGRFTGASWGPHWINDLLDIGKVTAQRYAGVASSVRGLADGLGTADREGR